MTAAIRDTWLIFERSLYLTLKQPVWVIFGVIQPVMFLVLFGPLLEGAPTVSAANANAFNWFLPGLLMYLALFSLFVGFGLIAELRNGVVERMRVTPMSRVAMLLGRALRDVVILVSQAILMMVIAIPFGLQVDPIGALVTLALLALVGLATATFSYTLGLMTRSEDALAPIIQAISLPLLLLSGILLPMALAPDWLQTLSDLNPLTHGVNAARALFNGAFGDPEIGLGVGVAAIAAVLAVLAGARAFSRAAA